MGIRETLNKSPGIAIGATLVMVAIAVYVVYGVVSPAGFVQPSNGYFTTDEGKTLFVAGLENIAPFQHEGKEAVRARVFTCDGGKTTFVAYLEKHTDAYKAKRREYDKAMEAFSAAGDGKDNNGAMAPVAPDQMLPGHTYLKRTGQGDWILWASPGGDAIVNQKCPNGSYADFIEQFPR